MGRSRARVGTVCIALALLAGPGACALQQAQPEPTVGVVSGARGESTAERLHRHGVHCMDDLERKDCAIENFEQLMAVETSERELVGDAIFRLIKLYKSTGRSEDVQPLLRKYWDVGMELGSSQVAPYAARYLPSDMTVMFAVSPGRLRQSKMWRTLSDDVHDTMFTCDEARRKELEEKQKERRKAARARGENHDLGPSRDRDRGENEKSPDTEKEKKGEKKDEKDEEEPPVFAKMCELAHAFEQPDMRSWERFTTAVDHWNPKNSMMIVEMNDLDAVLDHAVTIGSIIREDDRVWNVPEIEYDGAPIKLVKLDSDEVVMTPSALAADLLAAFEQREERLHPDMRELLDDTPDDVVFYTAMTRPALMWGLGQAPGFVSSMIPKPHGMVISAAAYEYAGVFVRMRTPDRLKGAMLVGLVRLFMQGQMDPESNDLQSQLLADMDLSQTDDGSIIFSAVLSSGQVDLMFME